MTDIGRTKRGWRIARLLVMVAVLLLAASARPSSGQDLIEVRNAKTETTVKRKGEIRDWQGSALTLELNGRAESISNDSIVRIETSWSLECLEGRKLLEQRQFAAAIPLLARAAAGEKRVWAASMIRADLVRALLATGKEFDAVQQFLMILSKDPETRFMQYAPLAWDTGLVDTQFTALARQCLESSQVNVQLIGASWLLGTAERAVAVELLGKLKQDIRPEVAHLASAQLWRAEVPKATAAQVDAWMRQIERMPESLRAGPLLLAGMAQARLKQNDDAVLAWLELPILHPEDYRLAAGGLARAAGLLETQGQTVPARRIWSELTQRYPGTQWAAEAETRLKKD